MSVLKKIKDFFSSIFSSKKLLKEGNVEETKIQEREVERKVIENGTKTIFDQANEQSNLMSLQKMYLQGKIKEEDLTKEQIAGLEKLFDSQIENTKRNNSNLQRKIIKSLTSDKAVMEVYRKVKNGEIDEDQLTEDQIAQMNFLLDIEIEKTKMQIEQLKYRAVQA